MNLLLQSNIWTLEDIFDLIWTSVSLFFLLCVLTFSLALSFYLSIIKNTLDKGPMCIYIEAYFFNGCLILQQNSDFASSRQNSDQQVCCRWDVPLKKFLLNSVNLNVKLCKIWQTNHYNNTYVFFYYLLFKEANWLPHHVCTTSVPHVLPLFSIMVKLY